MKDVLQFKQFLYVVPKEKKTHNYKADKTCTKAKRSKELIRSSKNEKSPMAIGTLLRQYESYKLQCESEYTPIDDNKDIIRPLPNAEYHDYEDVSEAHIYCD